MTSASTLKTIRLTHNYVGVFFAPTILFFAITGGLQMFGLHEASRGSTYAPPAFLVHLAQLHKKGTPYLPQRKPAGPEPAKREGPKSDPAKPVAPATPQAPPHNPLPTKIFFGATALALVTSTLSGLFMSWKYARRKATVLFVLLAGIVLPVLLTLL